MITKLQRLDKLHHNAADAYFFANGQVYVLRREADRLNREADRLNRMVIRAEAIRTRAWERFAKVFAKWREASAKFDTQPDEAER